MGGKQYILTMKPLTLLRAICLICCTMATDGFAKEYNNPTTYTFSATKDSVIAVLRKIHGPRTWGPMAGAYLDDEGVYALNVGDYYTKRYWSGRQESATEVDPPEAGRIGTISAEFEVRLMPLGTDK